MACNPFPCDCCQPCTDYYDPDEWYAVFCLAQNAANDSYANRSTDIGGTGYYYSGNTLASDINGMLINWQFAGTEPSTVAGNTKTYRSPLIDISSVLDRSIDQYEGVFAAPEASYVNKPVTLANCEAQFIVVDICGQRSVLGSIYADVSYDGNTMDRPKKYTYPLWQVSDAIPYKVSCSTPIISYTGSSQNIIKSSLGVSLLSPLLSIGFSASGKLKVESNNSGLSC